VIAQKHPAAWPESVNIIRALSCAILLSSALLAAADGSVSGTVTDPTHGVVPSAKVTIINSGMNFRHTVSTDPNGNYSFPELAVGAYELQVEAIGFKIYRRTNIVLDANSAIHIDVPLVVGDQAETVAVAANAVRVDTVDT
jgi:hypothetical protein